MSRSKRPLYRLLVTERVNNKSKTFAGVAFEGNYGQLNIRLNPGVRLDWRDMDSVWLTLTPYTSDYNAPDVEPMRDSEVEEPTKVGQAETSNDHKPATSDEDVDNKFPF